MQISKFPELADELSYLYFIQLSIFGVIMVAVILLIIENIKKKNNIF